MAQYSTTILFSIYFFFFSPNFPLFLVLKSGFSSQAQTIFMHSQLGKEGVRCPR